MEPKHTAAMKPKHTAARRGLLESRIILVTGPKHSGKSLCARALANAIGGEAVDLDEAIKKDTGKSPRELFLDGPEIFRKAEALALGRLFLGLEENNRAHPNPLIIAAGGGLIDNSEALALVSRHKETIIVYLDVLPETAWQRILDTASVDGELPPFLGTDNPKKTHMALHKRRAEAYKALAGITINAEGKSPNEIAKEIAEIPGIACETK